MTTRKQRFTGMAHAMTVASTLVLTATARAAVAEQDPSNASPPSTLWYASPAAGWKQALPLGNGRLGAMVFGDVDQERIQFNEDSVWTGEPPKGHFDTDGPANISKIRQLVFEGKSLEAQNLFTESIVKDKAMHWHFASYQPTGDLWLDFEGQGAVSNYRRELTLDTAVSKVTYTRGGVNYTRETLVSHPDQAIIVRLTADQEHQLSLRVKLTRPQEEPGGKNQGEGETELRKNISGTVAGNMLILDGATGGAVKFQARLSPTVEGGTVGADKDSIVIKNANSVTLHLVAETNFINYRDVSRAYVEAAGNRLRSVARKTYDTSLSDHIKAHQAIYNRLQIELPKSKNGALPTDERLKRFAAGETDPSLAALILQFGRYTLLTSSRPNTQPANLQGIWNNSVAPSWNGKYTTNINFQMNYWPVDTCNLRECIEPFVRKLEEWSVEGNKTAKVYFGIEKGWTLGFNSDLWSGTDPKGGGYFGAWQTGGVWCCTQLWEHYLFHEDRAFLERAYPVMKGAAEFMVEYLAEHPESGCLVTCPSASPENWYKVGDNPRKWSPARFEAGTMTTICAGPTMDNQLIRYLFDACAKASEILKRDEAFRTTLRTIIPKLTPNKIGRHGQLQEWMHDWDDPSDDHRHFSHLWGMYPGTEISVEDTPELAKAVAQSLKLRTENGTGFGQAWQICLWARMYQSDTAHRLLRRYVKDNTCENLFSRCYGTMQVDGTLGITSGIVEMLLQSHRGELHLLPALPPEWNQGRVKGLRARGDMSLDFEWKDSRIKSLTIHSGKEQEVKLRHAGKTITVRCRKGQNIISSLDD